MNFIANDVVCEGVGTNNVVSDDDGIVEVGFDE